MRRGIAHRHSLDPVLLWLWCKLAAIALIRPLAWEHPYASGVTLKRQEKKKKPQAPKNLAWPLPELGDW